MIVYIASPYTKGDVAANVSVQIEAAHRIMDMGHTPIGPLLAHFLHLYRQRPYEDWIKMDLAILPLADLVLRLPAKNGDWESCGADRECSEARARGITVVWGWNALKQHAEFISAKERGGAESGSS